MQERVAQATGWEPEYKAEGTESTFVVKTAVASVGGLKATAISHSPITTKVVSATSKEFLVLVGGETFRTDINGKSYTAGPGRNMLYVPEGVRVGRGGGYRSALFLQVDPQRYQKTASVMFNKDAANSFDFNSAHTIQSKVGSFNFEAALLELCKVMDQFIESPKVLQHLAVDESFYRLLVMATHPQWTSVEGRPANATEASVNRIDQVCEYVRANLMQSITLTDLERTAGMSTRALQYAFSKRFGMSPMQWVRQERLQAARQSLLNAQADDSVTSVVQACGIHRLSDFAIAYRRQFGELPSETLARIR